MEIERKRTFIVFLFILFGVFAGSLNAQAPPPQLISPPDGATDQPTTITFEWTSVSNADRYQIQIATDPSFSGSSIVFSDNTSSTSITISGFSHSTSYYWRVRSGTVDPLLGTVTYGDWSEIRNFNTVEAPPSTPELVSPEDGATEISTSPTLDWQPADRADTYQVQVDESNNFSSPVIDRNGLTTTEEQVSDLQSTTTYYWRLRASNNGGVGNWSEVRNFTTTEAPPPAVQLVAPDSGATNLSTTPRLEWEAADRADYYDLEVATDQSFNQNVVELNNVTSTFYEADLEGFTTYYWRVRGENDTGPGNWSQIWNFTTEQTGNEISIVSPAKENIWKSRETSSIRWKATNNIETLRIEYKLSSDKQWSTISNSVNAQSSPYAWDIPGTSTPSVQTLVRITDTDNPDIQSTSDPFIIYPDSLQLQQNYTFGSASSASDYQLLGLPANTDFPIDELIPGRVGDDWNAYFDNGTEQNYMIEYDGSDRFTTQPGRAFFVISKNDIAVSEKANSVQLSSDTTFAIPLHEGWNMIASPFGVAIPWQNIQARNDISSTLWGFDGQFTEATQMEPYKGYYFFNQDSLDELSIPYRPSREVQTQKKKIRENKQLLTLKLLRDGTEKSSIQFAFNASKRDVTYHFAPPGDFQDHKLTIESDKFSGRQSQLSKIILPSLEKKQTFYINLKSLLKGTVTLRAEGIGEFPSRELRLINRQTSKSYDLKKTRELFINPEQENSSYILVMGTQREVEETQSNHRPNKLTLSQNYPNPFNGQTVIEYSVPGTQQDRLVKLDIFNVIGQRVATLVNEHQSAGSHEVRWNAVSGNGQSLASGVYYYRLQVGEKTITKKLTLIE